MTDLRLVYLIGEPGVGKSLLMDAATSGWRRHPQQPAEDAPGRDWLCHRVSGYLLAVELGCRRDALAGEELPRTQPGIAPAEAYLRSGRAARETHLLLGEGTRLATRRFLSAALESGWSVCLLHLTGPDAAAVRRRQRAEGTDRPEPHPTWVKGRRTAAANLAAEAPSWGVDVREVNAALLSADPLYREAVAESIRTETPTPQ